LEGINVAIISYGRAGDVSTLEVAPFGKLWVCASQEAAYADHYGEDALVVIPDELDGSLARKRNAVLDLSKTRYTLMLDDDITGIGYWEQGHDFWLTPEALEDVIMASFSLAEELQVELWGVQQTYDPRLYFPYRPFSLLSPVLGPLCGHIAPSLRYDEGVIAKEDYDFWLQQILYNRKTLRVNKYFYTHKKNNKGGMVSQRSKEKELAGAAALIKKWGSRIVKVGGASGAGASGKNILNTRIWLPIKGV